MTASLDNTSISLALDGASASRKYLDIYGQMLHFSAFVTGVALSASEPTNLFQVPEEYTPRHNTDFNIMVSDGTSIRGLVHTDGTIKATSFKAISNAVLVFDVTWFV